LSASSNSSASFLLEPDYYSFDYKHATSVMDVADNFNVSSDSVDRAAHQPIRNRAWSESLLVHLHCTLGV
jgi:hypothetical protein